MSESHEKLRHHIDHVDEQQLEKARSSFDLTLVYNTHGSKEDAEESLENIPDNSIVLVEGRTMKQRGARRNLYAKWSLAAERLHEGHYMAAPVAIQSLVSMLAKKGKWKNHARALYQGLYDKNCVVLPADFININSEDITAYDSYLNGSLDTDIAQMTREGTDYDTLVARAMHNERRRLLAFIALNERREHSAVNLTISQLADILDSYDAPQLSQYGGKYRATIVFGAGHRKTLTEKFHNLGITPRTITLNTIPFITDVPESQWRSYVLDRIKFHAGE